MTGRRLIYKTGKALGNRGFSLVELIVSITILVLIMLPLLNTFYRSAQLNKKAKDVQQQSTLAANIMEGLRSLNIDDTIKQFTDPLTAFKVLPDDITVGGTAALNYDAITGTYEELHVAPDNKQSTYYFAINGILVDGSAYDALITMNAASYNVPSTNILNAYEMPEAVNLDVLANGVLFSNGSTTDDIAQGAAVNLDSEALNTFLDWSADYQETQFYQTQTYLDYVTALDGWNNALEEAQMQNPPGATPTPIPTPIPSDVFDRAFYPDCIDTELQKVISKTMNITIKQVTQDGTNYYNAIQYDIDYLCQWNDTDCGLETTIHCPVSYVTYPADINNIYLYYEPSVFQQGDTDDPRYDNNDKIVIHNQIDGKAIKFFLAYQGTDINVPRPAMEYIDETAAKHGIISVFTNLSNLSLLINGSPASAGAVNNNIVKTEQQNRIFDTEIKIYKYEANLADKYKDVVYTLSSATENSNLSDE